MMKRAQMARQEREYRSRLRKCIGSEGILKGSLTLRKHTCGKSNCKCARGFKHKSLYLTGKSKSRVEQLYIPKDKEKLARQWARNYSTVQELLEKISSTYWERLKKKE